MEQKKAKRKKFCRIAALVLLAVLLSCLSACGVYHRVNKGETLLAIADTYGVSPKDLQEANYLRDPDKLFIGQYLYVPGAKRYLKVKPRIKEKSKKRYNKTRKRKGKSKDKVASTRNVVKSKVRLLWPVDGVVVSGFGTRKGKMHQGIDIAAPEGTIIRAARAGEVIYSDNKQRGYGNLVIIEHSQDLITVYAHNKVNLIKEGERVKKGQIIGRVGKSGRASGFHCHFEVRKDRQPVNPLGYLD